MCWDERVTKADAAMSYDLGGVRMGRGCHTIGSPSAPAIKDKNLTDLSGCWRRISWLTLGGFVRLDEFYLA